MRKPGHIHPLHVEADEEFEGEAGSLRGIVAVVNSADLPIFRTDIESEPIAESRRSYVRCLLHKLRRFIWHSQSTGVSQLNVIYPVLDRIWLWQNF